MVDTNSVVPLDNEALYLALSQDLYEQAMVMYKALIFDGQFGPTENREAASVMVRARKILGSLPPATGDINGI